MKIYSVIIHVGENIRYHRTLQNMKGDTLAKALGITKSALSQIENGKTDISISRLWQIAELLQKDMIELIGKNNIKPGKEFHNRMVNDETFSIRKNEMDHLQEKMNVLNKTLLSFQGKSAAFPFSILLGLFA